MLYSKALVSWLQVSRKWQYTQLRSKKYLPFYLDAKKKRGRPRKASGTSSASSADYKGSEPVSSNVDVVSRLATPAEALEVLRSLRCSLPAVEHSSEAYVFRLLTRLDVRRIALRGLAMLPHPVGPNPRVVAICEEEEAPLALECGASHAGLDSILERIAGGWTNFDSCVTTTVHMPKLVKVARVLGPKKLMPNMKEGTLSSNLLEAVRRLSSANSVQFRAFPVEQQEYLVLKAILSRKAEFDLEEGQIGVIDVPIARIDSGTKGVIENARKLIIEVMKQRPTVSVKTVENQFRWPPLRKNVNTILDDAFSSLSKEGQGDNQFILAAGFGLSRQGKNITSPVMVDTGELF